MVIMKIHFSSLNDLPSANKLITYLEVAKPSIPSNCVKTNPHLNKYIYYCSNSAIY